MINRSRRFGGSSTEIMKRNCGHAMSAGPQAAVAVDNRLFLLFFQERKSLVRMTGTQQVEEETNIFNLDTPEKEKKSVETGASG